MSELSRGLEEVKSDALNEMVDKEIEQLRLAGKLHEFKPEPRCKVCRQANMIGIVNKLLAAGESYTNILKDLTPLNETLEKGDKVTYSSIRTHAIRHFNKDEAAAAVYRRILEQRAAEADVDFVDGVKNAVTPLAFVETTMNKGYQTLISKEGAVSVELGMRAAMTLHGMTKETEGADQVRELVDKTNRLVEIVRSVVPVSYWEEIVRRLESEEEEASPYVEAEVEEETSFLDKIEEDEEDV